MALEQIMRKQPKSRLKRKQERQKQRHIILLMTDLPKVMCGILAGSEELKVAAVEKVVAKENNQEFSTCSSLIVH